MADKKDKVTHALWGNVKETDFDYESNIIDADLAEYDLEAMTIFSKNVNLFRHLPRLQDSLKPVERRILYVAYQLKLWPNTAPKKSASIVGEVTKCHPHGDMSIYKTAVGMAQPWKTPLPLLQGDCNFGNDAYPDAFASMRYTELQLTRYAYDCFFKDFDEDCIETIFNTALDGDEPMALPARYPNILINGGFGIAIGNAFCIPTYNINDVVKLCKRLIDNPDHPDIFINPDIPTGCDIVDNGSLREICETGTGVLKMRATIDIEEDPKKSNVWILRVRNIPWMASLRTIHEKLIELTKDGTLPIKDIQDHSYPVIEKDKDGFKRNRKIIDYQIFINKAHDPKVIRNKIYKMTELEKTISVNFKVVEDALSIGKLNMRDLILAWLDARREYKRRLLNKRISEINARLSFLDVLIDLTSSDEKSSRTITIIRNSSSATAVSELMKLANMNSYQASKVFNMSVSSFATDAQRRYVEEREKLRNELEQVMKKIKNPKHIDEEIKEELDELLRYATPRKSRIISEEDGIQVSDTDHFVVITKQGMIKKLPHNPSSTRKTPSLGAFKNADYPIHGFVINNHDSLFMLDSFGRYSCVPVHTIENNEPSQYGSTIYDVSKLNGQIVSAFEHFSPDTNDFINDKLKCKVYLVTLTRNGYLKKTPITEFNNTRNVKNSKAMKLRDDDSLVCGRILLDDGNMDLLIYTEQGYFSYISSDDIAEQSKDSMGLQSIKLEDGDACAGMCVVGKNDQYLLVVTEKGCMKRCEIDYLGKPGKRKVTSYLTTLDVNDKVIYVDGIKDDAKITVCTRTDYQDFTVEEVPLRTRKAKCAKMVSVPLGNNIISVNIQF